MRSSAGAMEVHQDGATEAGGEPIPTCAINCSFPRFSNVSKQPAASSGILFNQAGCSGAHALDYGVGGIKCLTERSGAGDVEEEVAAAVALTAEDGAVEADFPY
ncbi:MAG: hypothetical protein JSU77_08815 [Fidelibacterota bacterium]|nr:MAG: hypothetical protein JSU77_08815 [Candidatus Neomarinimicrobiota bacterium]